ncbi:type B carboxylesterase [Chloropicon primus]|uniref:Carboxylic ester hydrolase n=1 Tax=Chloropicon primus TaxID=1764295 RepID=A0A5B8MWR4_9CHLO|nr:type B carboxylesterase [Chloropicon primus]UPR04126.1 type B carboxylesterase [Chloropicon primus]|eukprot:QDZ24917.1 type B carboxylesterase [Chloropicon primus]
MVGSKHLTILILLAALSTFAAAKHDDTLVITKFGPVRGSRANGTVSFLGIPFAQPPVNELRFASPVPPTPWTETLNATEFAPGCPQMCKLPDLMCPDKQSEDCLYLNVYIPDKTPPKGGWPVYVFIHGGSFFEGAGGCVAYNGLQFARAGDLILVNLNYRLGALGWLTHKTEIKGNFGLQDQRLALQWVQDNIQLFGGNKDQVTVGGESAGAMSVISHLVSPLSKGLFHRAIVESGPLSIPFIQYGRDNKYYTQFIEDAQCLDAQNVTECLRSKKLETLVDIQESIVVVPLPQPIHYVLPWMPTYGNEEIPIHPYLAYKNGEMQSKVPLLTGSNREDGRPFIYAAVGFPLDYEAYDLALFALFGTHMFRVAQMYAKYTGEDNRIALQQLATDYLFTCPSRFMAKSFRAQGLPTFTYNFGYGYTSDFWGPYAFCCEGHSCHGVELPFVFDLFAEPSMKYLKRTRSDEELGLHTQSYWIDFVTAKSLDESSVLKPKSQVPWPQFDQQSRVWMNFTDTMPNVTAGFRTEACDMWDEIGYLLWQ